MATLNRAVQGILFWEVTFKSERYRVGWAIQAGNGRGKNWIKLVLFGERGGAAVGEAGGQVIRDMAGQLGTGKLHIRHNIPIHPIYQHWPTELSPMMEML